MKQVININYHGRIIPIEVTAYELLKNYTERLHRYFKDEPGKEEIVNDIEDRIGELFQARLKNGAVCITDADVQAVITSMGQPEEFDISEEENLPAEKQTIQSKTNINGQTRRLSRNEPNKIIGGVCAGISDYFNIDVTVVRLLFVVLFLSFGFGLIPYIVLWIVVPSSTQGQIGAVKKKLYRDGEQKLIGGVCSGISEFFGIDVWIPRVVFLLPLMAAFFVSRFSGWGPIESFLPGAILAYLICWIVLPEAKTTSEKLEMKGEKIDMNSIKNTITEEMKGVGDRVKKTGEEIKQQAEEKSKGFFGELGSFLAKIIRGVVKVLVFIVKFFIYSILVCIGLALLASLFGLTIGTVTLFPLKEYMLNGFWQNLFAVGTLFLFIILFIVSIIVWLIKKIAGIKTKNKWVTISFISLWVLGWVCLFGLISTLGKDFSTVSHRDNNEKEIMIQQPMTGKLIVKVNPSTYREEESEGVVFMGVPIDMLKDSIYINTVRIKIIRSLDTSFHVRLVNSAHGSTRNHADTTAAAIHLKVTQTDSILQVDEGIYITPETKFRNQQVSVLISVPEGKRIQLGDYHSVSNFNDEIWEFNDWENNRHPLKEFQMTTEGLRSVDELERESSELLQSPTNKKEIDSQIQLKKKIEQELEKKSAPVVRI